MHPPRVLTICNPKSGRIRRNPGVIRTLRAEIDSSVYREASSADEFRQAVEGLTPSADDVICMIGGDGTVHAVLSELNVRMNGRWPSLMLLPAGSTNMTAGDIGTGGRLASRMGSFLKWSTSPEANATTVIRPALRIQRPGRDDLCGMFFGAASISEGVRFFRERSWVRGLPGAATALLATLKAMITVASGSTRGWRMIMRVDGEDERKGSVVVCLGSTLNRLLLGARPYWGEESGPIHFTVVDRYARGLWTRLWRVARGRPGKALTPERGYLSRNARCVELTVEGSFVVDGEVYEASSVDGPLRVTATDGLRWIVPG